MVDAGNIIFASDFADVFSEWTTYTPTFSTGGGGGSIGSGGGAALTGRHKKIGRVCTVSFYLKFGSSGASAGSGEMRISLPFTAATSTDQAWLGKVYINDTSAGASGHFHGVVIALSAATYVTMYGGNAGQQVLNNAPIAWAPGDSFRGQITYETSS